MGQVVTIQLNPEESYGSADTEALLAAVDISCHGFSACMLNKLSFKGIAKNETFSLYYDKDNSGKLDKHDLKIADFISFSVI